VFYAHRTTVMNFSQAKKHFLPLYAVAACGNELN
jgi:hypothetical protein